MQRCHYRRDIVVAAAAAVVEVEGAERLGGCPRIDRRDSWWLGDGLWMNSVAVSDGGSRQRVVADVLR